MDIEQYEFNAMDKFMQDFAGQPLPIGQFLVEIHLMGLADELHRPDFPEFMQWWERLEACGLRPVWTELNLLTVTLHAEDSLPRCAEVRRVKGRFLSEQMIGRSRGIAILVLLLCIVVADW